jgi:hypothetical protein
LENVSIENREEQWKSNITIDSMTAYVRVGIWVFFRQTDFEDAGRCLGWCQPTGIGFNGIECSKYAVVG